MVVSSSQLEKRLLWHPRRENKFVVGGGSQISLYEWAPDRSEIRHVTSQHDLQFMKCFAWSPSPEFDDLIAVGASTGRIDLMRIEATKYTRNNVLSSGPIVSLPVRNSRSCNALAFSSAEPGRLAVGLDKVRGDPSLVVWDVQSAIPALSFNTSAPTPGASLSTPNVPQFSRGDMAMGRSETRILQQHAPTEIVSALAFLPQSAHLLLASISHRWLRLFDLRTATSGGNVPSKVHGIATDPFDSNRFACYADRNITIWDARRLTNALVTFTEKDAAADGANPHLFGAYSAIEFSSSRRGMLATMGRDALCVRFWDLRQTHRGQVPNADRSKELQANKASRLSWANLPWNATVDPQFDDAASSTLYNSLILSDTRKTKSFNRALSSFAFAPSVRQHTLTTNVMVVNKDGDLEMYAVHDTPKQVQWSARGELCIGAGLSCTTFPGYAPEPVADPWNVLCERDGTGTPQDTPPARRRPPLSATPDSGHRGEDTATASSVVLSSSLSQSGTGSVPSSPWIPPHEIQPCDAATQPADEVTDPAKDMNATMNARNVTWDHAIGHDISMIMRSRAIQGYGLCDNHRNMVITQRGLPGEQGLSEIWWWMTHSKDFFSSPTPVVHGFDFSRQGLIGIWEGFEPFPDLSEMESRPALPKLYPKAPQGSRVAPGSSATRTKTGYPQDLSSQEDLYSNFHSAITTLAARSQIYASSWKLSTVTSRVVQRQVALHLCGWSLDEEELAAKLEGWDEEGAHSRAACWLIFTRQHSRAIELLMHSKDESHRLMSGTLAALSPHGAQNNPQLRDHCERLIGRLQDPYFRALLTYLTSNDWSKVLEQGALPFRERLAIAFRFLDDPALSSYLHRIKECCCARGDIEGLILTGMTSMGIDILQSYVDRTGDVQSATILSAYISAFKGEDPRVGRWRDAYSDLLDGFKLFYHRVEFDIERGRLLQQHIEEGKVAPFTWAPKQIRIRCKYCNKPISKLDSGSKQEAKVTACPHCGRSLPRCSICLLTLSIVQDDARNADLVPSQHYDTIDDAIVICQTCRHGGHASHVIDWFFGAKPHEICPVADCDCRCGEEV